MNRVHTRASPPVFTGSFQRISHLYSTRSSTLNFSKPKLKLKTKYRISIRVPAIWNDFVEDCLKSIEKTPFFKVKIKSKVLSDLGLIKIVVKIKGLMIKPNDFL